jgi:ribonuclease T2
MSRITPFVLAAAALFQVALARECPSGVLSCESDETVQHVDPCCVPSPGGLFLFRQRFEADIGTEGGRWGIDGIDVLK